MTIAKVTVRWSGFEGAPGYSNFFFEVAGLADEGAGLPNFVRNSMLPLQPMLPTTVTLNFSSSIELIDESTGILQDYLEAPSTPPSFNGQGAGIYSAPTGGVINWLTSTVNNGRRIRGRTFLVPLAALAYQSDGTLSTTALGAISEFGDNMLAGEYGGNFVIWSRPRVGGTAGIGPVNSYRVPDMAAVLRSRRD